MTNKQTRIGIILAGGNGKRLLPLTKHISKQLLPLYDKPIIYYPLTSLILLGITEVIIITKPEEQHLFQKLLGKGEEFGIEIEYVSQPEPKGIAEAFTLTSERISGRKVCLILGDNFFYGAGVGRNLARTVPEEGATVLSVHSMNPQNYGVVEYDEDAKMIGIIEKPKNPPSDRVIPGMYFYDEAVVELAAKLIPSNRGELEITDLNNLYLQSGQLHEIKLSRGTAWFDLGTIDNLQAAAEFVRVVQSSHGIKIGEPLEAMELMW